MRIHYLGALLIAGCGDPVPEPNESDDVARMIGATIATVHGGAMTGAVNDSMLLAFGGMPWGFNYENGAISGSHGALAHKYVMVFCRDIHNQVLKPCTQMTNSAAMLASWSGSIVGPDLDLQSNRQGMWTLANLQTWMPTLTGSSYLQTVGTVGGRAYVLTAEESEAMVTPGPMIGGSIHLDIVITEPFELAIAADVVFDTPNGASLALDGDARYRIDLTTGEIE